MNHFPVLAATGLALALQATPMTLTTVARGANSGIDTPRTTVARTAAEWSGLWKEHAGAAGKLPPVDFSREMVVAVFMGTQSSGGHSIEISRIDKAGDDVVVTYRAEHPPPDAIVTMALTAPFHIVRTDAAKGKVTFKPER